MINVKPANPTQSPPVQQKKVDPRPFWKRILDILNVKQQLNRRKMMKLFKEQQQKRQDMVILFRTLRELIRHIDSKMANRAQRKQFWSDFVKSEQLRIETIDKFIAGLTGNNAFVGKDAAWKKARRTKQQKRPQAKPR